MKTNTATKISASILSMMCPDYPELQYLILVFIISLLLLLTKLYILEVLQLKPNLLSHCMTKKLLEQDMIRMLFSLTQISSIFEILESELHGISHYCRMLCKSKNLWQRKLVLFFTFYQWGKFMCRGIEQFVHDQGQQQQ